jgi:hypothetical protein
VNFQLGFAGIPPEVYDAVYRERAHICGDNCEFVSEPCTSAAWHSYSQSHANFFLRKFANLVATDHDNLLRDTGFALLYIAYEEQSTRRLVEQFFPSTFCYRVEWHPDWTTPTTVRRSQNDLVQSLRRSTDEVRRALPPLKKEVLERHNRTPLLLPIKNFHSRFLAPEIRGLQEALRAEKDKAGTIRRTVGILEQRCPLQRDGGKYRRFFIDDRNVEFEPPGRVRHAFARPQSGHPFSCLLGGRRRLGAPYDRAFHYDCTKGRGNIRELFYGCHEPQVMREAEHLNIAPNDFVRG